MHMQALQVDAALPMTADRNSDHIWHFFAQLLKCCHPLYPCHEDRCLAQANIHVPMLPEKPSCA